jgi:DNA-binding transcriptional MerR regulator
MENKQFLLKNKIMQEEVQKVYYTIGETAEMFQVNPSLLRYWEKEFDVIKPFKNKKGDRYFSLKDIETIRTIHYLTKVKGYTLQGAKDAMKHNPDAASGHAQIVETLTKIKEWLLKIKEEL